MAVAAITEAEIPAVGRIARDGPDGLAIKLHQTYARVSDLVNRMRVRRSRNIGLLTRITGEVEPLEQQLDAEWDAIRRLKMLSGSVTKPEDQRHQTF